jgi:hypothetical protein
MYAMKSTYELALMAAEEKYYDAMEGRYDGHHGTMSRR